METTTFVICVLTMILKLTFVTCVINVFVLNVSIVNIGDMSVMRMIYPIIISAVRSVGTGGWRGMLFHATVAA